MRNGEGHAGNTRRLLGVTQHTPGNGQGSPERGQEPESSQESQVHQQEPGSPQGTVGGNGQQPAENVKRLGMPYIILKDGWGPESTQNPAENGQEPESTQGGAGNEQQPGSPQESQVHQQEPGFPQGPAENGQEPESTQESPMSGSEPGSSEDFMDDDS
ncbi:hypothetical protein BASA60_002443, partial [Batrachochytrium salamandrivorans]